MPRPNRFALCCVLFTLPVAAQSTPPQALRGGAARLDITPATFPVESAGMMTPTFAESAHDRLHARCLVLDNGESQIALVTCDSCMIPREVIDPAKARAAAATGIPPAHILCSATHTHSAVAAADTFQSDADRGYQHFLTEQIAEVIVAAHARLQPVQIGWAVGTNPRHVFNRRWYLREGEPLPDPFEHGRDRVRMNPPPGSHQLRTPAGPVDAELPVLAVRTTDGEPLALWANYALHYVGGAPRGQLSADYFGEFARVIERTLAGESLVACLTNGASGNINNIDFFRKRERLPPFTQIQRVAEDVAASALQAYGRIVYRDWVPLAALQTEVSVGVRRPSADEVAQAQSWLGSQADQVVKDRKLIYAKETLALANYPPAVPVRLQTLRIGPLGIAALPCETFVETGLALKRESPLQPTWIVALANGYRGYLPTAHHHELGGYETWRAKSSYLAVDAERHIRQQLLGMLHQLKP